MNKFEIEESSKVIDLEVAERIQLVSGDKSGLLVFYSLYSKSALRVIKFEMGIIACGFTPKNQLLVSLSEKDKGQFKSKIVVIEGDKRSEIMSSRSKGYSWIFSSQNNTVLISEEGLVQILSLELAPILSQNVLDSPNQRIVAAT